MNWIIHYECPVCGEYVRNPHAPCPQCGTALGFAQTELGYAAKEDAETRRAKQMDKKCAFCEYFESVKAPNNTWNSLKYEYRAALVIRFWYKDSGKRTASKSTAYGNAKIGYKLNFCPECGRRINDDPSV